MRKLKVFVAMLAMVLLTASPAMAQQIEFVDGGVLVAVEGTATLEEPPITGAGVIPGLFAAGVAGGDTFGFVDLQSGGAFAGAGETTFAGAAPEGIAVQAGDICIDTTDFGLCP